MTKDKYIVGLEAEILALRAERDAARAALREEIARGLENEADMVPCKDDSKVLRGAAWLVRGSFSHDEAERLEAAARTALAASAREGE